MSVTSIGIHVPGNFYLKNKIAVFFFMIAKYGSGRGCTWVVAR